jgi:hypothetical protein
MKNSQYYYLFDVNLKVMYVRYIHDFLLNKGDNRCQNVRDWLYKNSNNSDLVMRIDIDMLFHRFRIAYPELFDYPQWVRDLKINQLLSY